MAFVVAALILAVLLADRIGPAVEIKRRIYQIALAFSLVVFISAIIALVVPSDFDDGFGENADQSERDEIARVASHLVIIRTGIALGFVLAAFLIASRLPTIYLGLLLGGVIVLALGMTENVLSIAESTSLYGSFDPGILRNSIHLVVTAIGLLMLLIYGYREWDRHHPVDSDTPRMV